MWTSSPGATTAPADAHSVPSLAYAQPQWTSIMVGVMDLHSTSAVLTGEIVSVEIQITTKAVSFPACTGRLFRCPIIYEISKIVGEQKHVWKISTWIMDPVSCKIRMESLSRLECTSVKLHSNYGRDSFFVHSYACPFSVSPHKLLHWSVKIIARFSLLKKSTPE